MADEPGMRDVIFRLAGAATGIVVFVGLAGGTVTAARLHALGLPVEATLAVLPHEQVLTAGVQVLSTALAAATLVYGVLWFADHTDALEEGRTGRRGVLWVPALALGPMLIYTVFQSLTAGMVVVVAAATVVAGAALVVALTKEAGFGPLRAGFFALVAVYAGVLAFARAYSPPVQLDFADVQLTDGGRTNGYFLGQSSDVVILAPAVLGHTVGRTMAIERAQIADLRISRVEEPVRPIGPQPVSRFTVDALPAGMRPLGRTLLRIMLSAQWKYPPLVYRQSVISWSRSFRAFQEGGGLPRGIVAQRTRLEDLNEQTPLFAGKLVSTRGEVLEATPWERRIPQTIVFRQPSRPSYLATCDIWTTYAQQLRPSDPIDVRGIVVASGIFVSGSGTSRHRIAMVCAPP